MLVVVAVGEIDLADAPRPLWRGLGEDAISSPSRPHADLPRESVESANSPESVAETRTGIQIGMRPEEGAERRQERPHEKAHDAAVQTVGVAGVIALAEVQREDRGSRSGRAAAKARALVVQHVSGHESDVLDVPRREEISERHPDRRAPCHAPPVSGRSPPASSPERSRPVRRSRAPPCAARDA